MVIHYCDKCNKKLLDEEIKDRMRVTLGEFKIELMTAKNLTWNSAELCFKCQKDIVNKGIVERT